MRIANRISLSQDTALSARAIFFIALGILSILTAPVRASEPAAGAPMLTPPPLPPSEPVLQSGDLNKTINALEDKASESAKTTIKHLDSTTDTVTFEDLNSARQTIARIDALIEVEKHMSELDKLRGERGGAISSSALAGVIPASALRQPALMAPAPSLPTMPSEEMRPRMSMPMMPSEVSRIMGSEGTYSAVLKLSDGSVRNVRVGDKVSDGTVQWISSSAVGLEVRGETRILRVKNVDAVYSVLR